MRQCQGSFQVRSAERPLDRSTGKIPPAGNILARRLSYAICDGLSAFHVSSEFEDTFRHVVLGVFRDLQLCNPNRLELSERGAA